MDEDTTTIETGAPLTSGAQPPATGRRPSVVAVVIAILVALVLAEAVLLFRGNGDERARTDVLQTSSRLLAALTTYNASTIAQQRTRVLALATGKFRQDYEQVTSPSLFDTLRKTQAELKGTILRVAVASVEGDSATVLALVRTSTTNKDLKAPRVEVNVFELSLVHTRNGWRIDNVQILGALSA
jgi:Mce-associated membrane protein